jgi:hypothetical protein
MARKKYFQYAKPPERGDLVFLSDSPTGDPAEKWTVGYFSKKKLIGLKKTVRRYRVQNNPRYYKYLWRVSERLADKICADYPRGIKVNLNRT